MVIVINTKFIEQQELRGLQPSAGVGFRKIKEYKSKEVEGWQQ